MADAINHNLLITINPRKYNFILENNNIMTIINLLISSNMHNIFIQIFELKVEM